MIALEIVVAGGERFLRILSGENPSVTIGRKARTETPEVDLPVASPLLARRHCRVSLGERGDSAILEALESPGPIAVAGQVVERCELRVGDEAELAGDRVTLRIRSAPSSPPAGQ